MNDRDSDSCDQDLEGVGSENDSALKDALAGAKMLGIVLLVSLIGIAVTGLLVFIWWRSTLHNP